jgi:hypothetical protein
MDPWLIFTHLVQAMTLAFADIRHWPRHDRETNPRYNAGLDVVYGTMAELVPGAVLRSRNRDRERFLSTTILLVHHCHQWAAEMHHVRDMVQGLWHSPALVKVLVVDHSKLGKGDPGALTRLIDNLAELIRANPLERPETLYLLAYITDQCHCIGFDAQGNVVVPESASVS